MRRSVIVVIGAGSIVAVGALALVSLTFDDASSDFPTDRASAVSVAARASSGSLDGEDAPAPEDPFTCDVVVPTDQNTITGDSGIGPGTVVCLEGGTREPFHVLSVRGEPARPVTVVNLGHVVISGTHDDYAGIKLTDSADVRVSGAGDEGAACGSRHRVEDQQCGILIEGTARGIAGVEMITGISIDHVEITGTSHSALFIRTKAEHGLTRDGFVQRGTNIHSTYLHDLGKEGMYIGSSSYSQGEDPVLEGVRISHNLVVMSGWDGIQVGSAVADCSISWNTVVLAGAENTPNQNSGIIANRGSVCDIHHNVVVGSAAQGIFVQGNGENAVHNNLIVGAGLHDPERGDGITIRTGSNTGAPVQVAHNTVVAVTRYGIFFNSEVGEENSVSNNFVVAAGREALVTDDTEVRSLGNVVAPTIRRAAFVDAAGGDFRPTERSPAAGAAAFGYSGVDLVGVGRSQDAPTAGALEPLSPSG
ncbi:MAG TPA: right-handed parallel beta-helix repeat-containing protein [Acidimicrobiia bacterium]|nr:right-handed parallel beta-helix repeat-containing protein [Acidimicrobiia bacterium]